MKDYILRTGDIVRLKKAFKPQDWKYKKSLEEYQNWPGFEWGIVVEIVSTQYKINGESYGNKEVPRIVSLHLYDEVGQLYLEDEMKIPTSYDSHISELELYKIATEIGYRPVIDSPDWSRKARKR